MGSIRSWMAQRSRRQVALATVAVALIAGGGSALGVAASSQYDAPQPTAAVAGATGPIANVGALARGQATPHHRNGTPSDPSIPTGRTAIPPAAPTTTVQGPVLVQSAPVTISIPAISVQSTIQDLGLNPDGTLAVPAPGPLYNEAAWYDGSPTPGQVGPSIIEGHIDSAADGPSVFFRLGALGPGDEVDVTRADGTVAVFTVTGVRQYPKDAFPTTTVYGNTDFAALRLITCGGDFDPASGHYLANTVVFAALTSSHPAQ